ncbi:hypothetical protein QTG54_007422 [Skeletonema marinoi]|uniref:Uncharacterized protein n=1 Tax=Skeletonema marinoi TaxID=267567 RepID=A0AAD8Y8N0_9STRA|nr:hypothetical protein QTG54_007422 [Skeletonema marinoi]
MSSRSTSPTPLSKGGGSESGGVASLSNDALYTPLSSLHADNNHPSNNSNQTQSKKKSRHSLSLQTSASLRESSLVTFLTSMGNNLKTSHPQECHVYRGLGGSIGRYGTGDGGRVDKAMRSTMENKLSNRSLVLVGGGIHSYTPATTSSGGDAKSGGNMARSSKRIRKRVGGNGVFGCKSHRQRKKAMNKVTEETRSRESATTPAAEELDEKVGNIVETLHQMWINYIQQILSPLKKKSRAAAASISLEARKEIATILATSEHVGMAATIVACPSRRHLGSKRCIVLDETKETFKIAIMKSRPAQAQKKVTETNAGSGAKSAKPYLWKVVMIPKHGTSLDVSVPWSSGRDRIIVRLET